MLYHYLGMISVLLSASNAHRSSQEQRVRDDVVIRLILGIIERFNRFQSEEHLVFLTETDGCMGSMPTMYICGAIPICNKYRCIQRNGVHIDVFSHGTDAVIYVNRWFHWKSSV